MKVQEFKDLIKKKGMNMQQVSVALGMNKSYIYNLHSGKDVPVGFEIRALTYLGELPPQPKRHFDDYITGDYPIDGILTEPNMALGKNFVEGITFAEEWRAATAAVMEGLKRANALEKRQKRQARRTSAGVRFG